MTFRAEAVKVVVCAVVTGVFALYTAAAWQLDLGQTDAPGAGLMPRIIGVAGLIVGALSTLASVRQHRSPRQQPVQLLDPEEGTDNVITGGELARLTAAVVAIAALAALTPVLGFALAAFVCATALAVIAGQSTWWKALLIGMGTALATSFLFVSVLAVPLPAGILG